MTSLVGNSNFTITDAKLYVPVVTLSIEHNAKLTKLLNERFKKSVYWNKYKVIPNKTYNANNYIRELLDYVLKDYLFLPMIIQMLIELQKILIENIFFQQ